MLNINGTASLFFINNFKNLDMNQSQASIEKSNKYLDQLLVKEKIRLYPYRYLSLIVYCMMAAVNGFAPQTFVAISIEIGEIYNQSPIILNMTSLSHTLAHSFVVFPANYILDHMGLKAGIILGNGFLILGYLFRILISHEFWFYILGTYITSFGFIFVLNGATKFTNTWFGVKETTFVNTLILFLLFTSNPIGVLIPALFINHSSTKQDVFNVVLYISIVLIGIYLLGILIIRDKPPSPANHSSKQVKQKYWESIKYLVKDKNYIILFMTVTVSWGSTSSCFVTMAWQLKLYGFKSSNVAIILLCANGLGLIGSLIIGAYVQRVKIYKKILVILIIGGTICTGLFWMSMEIFISPIPLYVSASLIGLFLFPFFTTLIDLSNQVSFPIGQATSSGFLLCGGQLFGFALGLLMSKLFDGESFIKTRIGTAIYTLMFFLAAIFLCFFKEDLKRLKYEKQNTKSSQIMVQKQ